MSEESAKDRYVKEQLGLLSQKWIPPLAILTGGLFLFFIIFDYYLGPHFLLQFLPHRIGISIIMVVIIIFCRRNSNLDYQYGITMMAAITVAGTIEIISISFKEHNYFYYNGMHLIVMACLGFLPLSRKRALALIATIYAIFLIPVAIFDRQSLTALPFILLNAYLMSTCILAYAWRISHQKTLVDWLELQYELRNEKRSLQDVVQSQSKKIEKTEILLSEIISKAKDGIIIMNKEGSIVTANPSACAIYDRETAGMLGRHITVVGDEKNAEVWSRQMEQLVRQGHLLFELDCRRDDGTSMTYEVGATVIQLGDEHFVQAMYRDLTERRNMERQLLMSRKMESMGMLAGGIAHDFKNILATVQGFVDYTRGKLQSANWERTRRDITEGVAIVEEEVKKASEVVFHLLSFGKKGDGKSSFFDLNNSVQYLIKLYSKIMSEVKIEASLDSSLPRIQGNKGLIEQALANLAINASEAMPHGGSIYISTELVGSESVGILNDEEKGKYAKIVITDTGIGIPEDKLERIFDPFFTTKENNTKPGTGLGLSMVYSVVKEHGGHISVDSVVGRGTTFVVHLPIIESSEREEKLPSKGGVKG